MNVTLREMYSIAKEFLDKEYGLELIIPIEPSPNMKKMFGYFQYYRKDMQPKIIKISEEFARTQTREVIIDVLKHELVHYALFMLGKPHCDKDAYFKAELDRLGICRTRTYKALGKYHLYLCNDCGREVYRKRRLQKNSYCTCQGKGKFRDNIQYVGVVNIEG